MYKNKPTSESDAFGGRWEEEDLLWGVSPEIEKYFTHDFKCCGIELADLHECIKHYELYHVRDERKRPLPPPPPSNSSTSLATAAAAAQRRPSSGTNATFGVRNSGKPNSSVGSGGPLGGSHHHHQSKRRHMFLDFEANEGAAFDNTVIREGYFPRTSTASSTTTTSHAAHHQLRQETREKSSQLANIPASSSSNSTALPVTNSRLGQSHNSTSAACEISKPLSTGTTTTTNSSSPYVTVTFPKELEDGINAADSSSSPCSSTLNQESPRPYACTFPGCNRTYKNLNGLKYHATHGHLTPANDAEKPYECPVYACAKRYKNPNGLKYHMDHAHKNLEFASSTMTGNAAKGLVSVSSVVGNKLPIE